MFVVKDDYAATDLTELLSQTEITDYEIYTVKTVKGLEFKEVYVFDAGMTLNEKYISYTRALVTLNVIKSLPESESQTEDLIQQGNEEAEEQIY